MFAIVPLVFCGVSTAGKETGCPGAPERGGEGEDHPHTAAGATVDGEDKVRAGTCSYLSGCLLHHAKLNCFFFSLQMSPKLTQAHIYTFLHTCTYTHYIYVNPDGAASFILFSVIIAIHCYSHYHLLTYTLILPHMTPPTPLTPTPSQTGVCLIACRALPALQ